MALEIGQVFAGYTILRVLGAGGMGAVYLARHPRLPREDALKVLPANMTGDPEYRARFAREAELAAGLSHPHIVAIQDRGEHDGQFWITMDYVEGTDAAALLGRHHPGGIPLDQVAPIIAAVASALDYAHGRGLLHRDVKPANILLAETHGQPRRVFLADFGIARRIDDVARLTATNMALGTAAYAAPEQLMGEPLDGRADQYALACTAFHLLTGTRPYSDGNLAVVIGMQVSAPPPSIGARRTELAGLDPVFATAMAKNPSGRFANCGQFADQLQRCLDGHAPLIPYTGPAPVVTAPPVGARRRRFTRIGVLAAVALLIVAGGLFAGVKLTQRRSPAGTAGPLSGVYRADFGPITGLGEAPNPVGPPALTGTYGFRSVCGPTGCVATATRLGGAPVAAATLVFDQIDGRWTAVSLGADRCQNKPAEFWQVFTLRPGPEGRLAGEYTATTANVCTETRTVSLTQISDADASHLPDPADQPRRVPSPAEHLHGRYQLTRDFATGNPPFQSDLNVTTHCLRTGDRCMSYLHGAVGDLPLVFGGEKWVLDIGQDAACPRSAAVTQVTTTARYALPQPPHDPIPLLTGHGHQVQSGSCALDTDFDDSLTRISD